MAALAAAGCGVGRGEAVGEASLVVSRDYGAERLLAAEAEPLRESDTAMRLLDREAEISTRYGGGFVSSIEGLAEGTRDGRRRDWFFYVNGVESPVGAAEYELRGGETVWWDHRDWSAASRVPAVVGSWPRPLSGGYEGRERPVVLRCRGGGAACGEAGRRLREAGVELAGGAPRGAIRVLVGPWARLRDDPAAAQLERGPQASGVFARPERRGGGFRLVGLDEAGEPGRRFGAAAGLVAATRHGAAPPSWLVTGSTAAGVRAAAALLEAPLLRDRYAVAGAGGEAVPLPLEAR